MDVVARGKQHVVVARLERTLANEVELAVARLVELFVLIALVQPNGPPGEVVVHGRHRPGRHDKTEQEERAIGGSEEKPLADPAAHPALRSILLEFGVADETAWNVGLSCGGRIRVYVEKVD